MTVAAYVYPGWHPIPERDFTEWPMVTGCRPRFPGHAQPRVPALGPYDDRDPVAVEERIALALAHGVNAFVYGFFWCRTKRVFQDALDLGFLGSTLGAQTPFALMWANRLPRRVLPVRRADLPVIAGDRLVHSDVEDFVALIEYLADGYFSRANYLLVDGVPYFSIFDATFFVRELGDDGAAEAIRRARRAMVERGFGGLHLAAIDPNAQLIGRVAQLGFDSVTHYVLLPTWKGPREQDYRTCAAQRASEWTSYQERSGLPYMPSVAPGWDASPRAADFGSERPNKYPWSPVVTGEHPDLFHDAFVRAVRAAPKLSPLDPLVFVASLNEWSEGHYLEPDTRFGTGWLEALGG